MQVEEIAKQRFESFKLGLPSPTASVAPRHRHARSHSRNASISSTTSLPAPNCTTTNESVPPTQSLPPPPKRNSHHRRVSSVSTRRESADMMGVSVPDSVLSPAEEAGEKDSVRRHALWALEGKRDASFSKVEIPELTTPFEFPTKPSFPPGSGTFMNTGKRDSFKPSSSKDALGTLVEEEEEEEDSDKPLAPPTPTTPTTFSRRPRPPHLRPLSLTPDNLPLHNLPAPSSPRRSSLKLLALAPDAITTRNAAAPSPTPLRSRPVLNIKLSETPSTFVPGPTDDNGARPQPIRRSSISYKSSPNNPSAPTGLPTPEATPTCSERRFSGYTHSSMSSRTSLSSTTSSSNRAGASDDEFLAISAASRPLSASEQHFLFKSHNALLARITDLERALSFRNNASSVREGSTRPSSVASAVSATSSSSSRSEDRSEEPLDEMLSLVSDLKAERDELKRDVEGWRVRVADLEKQLVVVGNRVEVERREAWVARTRVGLLEVERGGLEKHVGDLESENQRLRKSEEDLQQQVARLLEEKETLAAELQTAKSKVSRDFDPLSTPRAFDGPVVAVNPVASSMKRGLGFASLGLESSASDVEEGDEEEEDESGLAGYEDEDENDVLISPSSSFGSVEEFNPQQTVVEAPAPQPVPAPEAAHVKRLSISKWTFPRNVHKKAEPVEQEIDRFFGCLVDLDEPPSPNSPKYSDYDEEKSKGMFAKGFSYNADTKSCFVLPAGLLAEADATFVLDAVEEEAEEEDEEEAETEGETVVEDGEISNGIKITFTPPAEEDRVLEAPLSITASPPSPSRKPVPSFAFFEDEEVEEEAAVKSFTFGRPMPATPESSITSTPPSDSRPSSIPRPTIYKSAPFTPPSPSRSFSPNSFVTPPTKRGGTMPSFIPQPASPSRSPRSTSPFSTNASTKPSTTFIRQPSRQPLMSKTLQTNADAAPHVPPRFADNTTARQGADMRSADVSGGNIPAEETLKPNAASSLNSPSSLVSSSLSSIMSSPLAGRLSFQTFTNYIPSWGTTLPHGAPNAVAAGHDTRPVAASAGPVKRGFVSKQSQLERLKTRLEREKLEGRGVVGKKGEDAAFL